jgi:hypothetical protein
LNARNLQAGNCFEWTFSPGRFVNVHKKRVRRVDEETHEYSYRYYADVALSNAERFNHMSLTQTTFESSSANYVFGFDASGKLRAAISVDGQIYDVFLD